MIGYIDVIGFAAGALTTLSLIPEVAKTVRMKETRDISMGWLGMVGAGNFLWLVYGLFLSSMPLIIANSLSLLLALIMVSLKLKYK